MIMFSLQLIELVQCWNLKFSNKIFDLFNIFFKQFDIVLGIMDLICEVFNIHYKLFMFAFGTEIFLLVLNILDVAALFVEVFCFNQQLLNFRS